MPQQCSWRRKEQQQQCWQCIWQGRERERPAHASPARDHVSSPGSTVLFGWWQLGWSTAGRKPGAVGHCLDAGVMQGPMT